MPSNPAIRDRPATPILAPGPAAVPTSGAPRGPWIAAATLLAVPSLLLLDTALAWLRGWRMATAMDRAMTTGIASVFALVAGGLLLPQARSFLRRQWAETILATLLGVVAWGMVEFGAAAFLKRAVYSQYHHRKANLAMSFDTRGSHFPGVASPTRFTTNSLGLRGPELPPRAEAYRILCVGGSTTECLYLDDRRAWPRLLMQRLDRDAARRVWVGNAGVSGYSTVEHLQFLERSAIVPQMDCLVFLVGVNDLILASDRDRSGPGDAAPLWSRSNVLELARLVKSIRWASALSREDPTGASYDQRRLRRQAAPKRPDPPDLDAPLAAYRGRIRKIAEFCRRRGIRPVFVNQPTLWSEGQSADLQALLWMGLLPDGSCLDVAALRRAMDRYNQALASTCDELSLPCIDLSPMDGRPAFFYDDCHFTDAGSAEVARRVADWFRSHPVK